MIHTAKKRCIRSMAQEWQYWLETSCLRNHHGNLANLENLVIKLISQVIKKIASGEIKQVSSLFDCDHKLEEYLLKSYYKTAPWWLLVPKELLLLAELIAISASKVW